MFIGTPELIAGRREEIMNACERLYRTMDFREITLKEISSITSFSRPTIYNYYQTKEEIFLNLFEREYVLWTEDLRRISSEPAITDRNVLAEKIAESIGKRELLLKLLAVNLYDIENNSRMELLVSFKKAYGQSREELTNLIRKSYPGLPEEDIQSFIFTFLPYMHGIYPYAFATEKQIQAMDQIGLAHPERSIIEIAKTGLLKMLP